MIQLTSVDRVVLANYLGSPLQLLQLCLHTEQQRTCSGQHVKYKNAAFDTYLSVPVTVFTINLLNSHRRPLRKLTKTCPK